jgi:predicted AlkP superfamily pyrophosphatase or phosphodiesterase
MAAFMKFPLSLLLRSMLLFIVCGLAACATHPAMHGAEARRAVLLVSIDGYRADYFQRGQTPTLAAMARDGVRAEAMQPSFPSLTFPNHYTLVTGLVPDRHGVVNNTMSDPKLGRFRLSAHAATADGRWWNGAEPIWVAADRQGLRTATMFWPGSEAEIRGYRPDYWLPYDGKVTPFQRVDTVLAWLDLPPGKRPDLLTLYFDAVDHQGHAYGPDSAQVNEALRQTDAALARLVDGLRKRGLYGNTDIVVVSDHGMAFTPPEQTIVADDYVDLDSVDVVALGVLAGFNPKPGHDFATAEKTLLTPHEHMQCWRKADVPARLDYGKHPRVPAVICLAQTGWKITSRDAIAKRTRPMSIGEHGYDNADPLMRALFVAHGPDFRPGLVVPEFPNTDVYPLLAHLLHIVPAANDGHYEQVKGMLTDSAQR